MIPLKLICSWCNDILRDGAVPASHGICSPCAARLEGTAVVSDVERRIEEAQRFPAVA